MNRKKLAHLIDTALAHHRAGRLEEAAQLYAEVCQATPRFFDAWFLAGALAFHRGGHLEQAIEYLNRALRLDPGSAKCKLFLGMALADAGRFAEAEKPLAAAVQKLPTYPEAWENLAKIYAALGNTRGEAEALRRLLEFRPDNAEIRERLEILNTQAGMSTAAA